MRSRLMRYPPNPAVWVRTNAGLIVKGNDTLLIQCLSPPINSTGDLIIGEGGRGLRLTLRRTNIPTKEK